MEKIAVLGCGSLGSTIGGLLTEAGYDVCLINPLNDHIRRMMDEGLTFIEGERERTFPVKVFTDSGKVGPVDLIIVLVKSNFTRSALAGAQELIGPDTVAMSLQNGLGNEEALAEYLGERRVLGGKTYVGGLITEPGKVKIGVKGKATLIGEFDGSISERARQIGAIFNKSGLNTQVITNIRTLIWEKLLVNVSTGAICGITGLTYGELVRVESVLDMASLAVAEALAVAKAQGIELSETPPRAILDKAVSGLPYDFKTSILQDIERGRHTEVDFINGAIVREGEKCSISTPVNSFLVAMVKGIEFRIQSRKGANQ